MENKPTPTIEDYLGIIFTLDRDQEKVIGARLAEILHVSPPTVTVTLKRMVRDGWIRIDHKKHIYLTEIGREAARSVIRRHMLTEWLLADILDVPLAELHDEAHKIEHSISEEVEERLAETMDEPDLCPHGNPLPGQEEVSKNWLPLTAFKQGATCTLKRIHELIEEDINSMQFLAENEILPGCLLEIISIDGAEGAVDVRVKENVISIPVSMANKLFAE